jgi:hypothetical protein
MIKTFAAVLAVTIAGVLVAGCSDQGAVKPEAAKTEPAKPVAAPPAAPAGQSQSAGAPSVPLISSRGESVPMIPPVPEGAGVGATGLQWQAPAGWTEEAPSSPMRRAQYRVPGGAGDGECVVFYFGPGQGGDPMSNARRWADQFTTAAGEPVGDAMTTSTIDVGGLAVFVVEVAGTYKGGMTMTAAPAVPKPGYRLLGAVAPGPDANWYFKLTGPDKTVAGQKDAFLGMVRSLKHGAS